MNVARVAAASALLLLLFAAVCIAAGRLPSDAAGASLAFAAGLIVTPFVASPFEWLVHRYVYHVDTEVNVNFLPPLADLLYGTLRRSLTAEELARHGTREAAKSRVVGAGEPAREALQTA